MMSGTGPVEIVILGGGFGGVAVAAELERLLRGRAGARITLVNRDNYTLFTPMLHEVAASDVDLTHVVNPLRKLSHGADLFVGSVEEIDLPGRRVVVAHGDDGHRHELRYDHLVLALGAVTNYFEIPGLAERALPMKSLGDAIGLRNRLIESLEQADFECAAAERRALLTFVVAGGGFAGVETVAAMNDFLRAAVRYYPHLRESDLRIVLVHGGDVVLPELQERLGRYAQELLARRGVEVRLGTRVAEVDGPNVRLSDGTRLDAGTLVWTAGTAAHPLVSALPCASEHGRVRVTAELQVPGWPDVWALGDCAAIPLPDGRGFYPPTAQHAVREGRLLARNLAATLEGKPRRPFSFRTLGQLAAIGRRAGVANIAGAQFSGFVAWWLWRTIYLAKLPRLERKLRVALDWTLDLLFSKDLVQFDTTRSHGDAQRRRPAPAPATGEHRAVPAGSEAS